MEIIVLTIKVKKAISLTKKFPHKILLPVGCKSPTNSIYKQFDIKQQTKALNTFSDNPRIVRCSEPFIITVKMKSGKIKDISSK